MGNQSQVSPPIPTQSPIVGPNGLVTRVWISWFTWLNGLFATIDSPAFTGGPTVPTATAGTVSLQIANTEFVAEAVSVETTRAESAEGALGNLIALSAPIASPTFTGIITQPDSSVLTDATTATSATAGSASSLPATPSGYLQISINGTLFKVPYYAV